MEGLTVWHTHWVFYMHYINSQKKPQQLWSFINDKEGQRSQRTQSGSQGRVGVELGAVGLQSLLHPPPPWRANTALADKSVALISLPLL